MPDHLVTLPQFHSNPDAGAGADGNAAAQIHDFKPFSALESTRRGFILQRRIYGPSGKDQRY